MEHTDTWFEPFDDMLTDEQLAAAERNMMLQGYKQPFNPHERCQHDAALPNCTAVVNAAHTITRCRVCGVAQLIAWQVGDYASILPATISLSVHC